MLVKCVRFKFSIPKEMASELFIEPTQPTIDYKGKIPGITIGLFYNVVEDWVSSSGFTMYKIENDFGKIMTYHGDLFETIQEIRDKKIDEIIC
jgi:hypothetical protein